MKRFLGWLTRRQFTAITVGAAYLLGNLAAFSLSWWEQIVAAGSIGVAWGIVSDLAPRLLRRISGGSPHPPAVTRR